MIGDVSASRSRRMAVAGGVLLAHALLVWILMLAGVARIREENPVDLAVVMSIGMPGEQQGPMEAEAEKPAVVRMQAPAPFQAPTPRIEGIVVDLPEVQVQPEAPAVVVDTSASASTTLLDSAPGLGGDAAEAGGRAGNGHGLVLLRKVMPVYPVTSVRRGEQGVTEVLIHVTPNGRVDKVRVIRGSGSVHLDRAAEEAFLKWRFAKLQPGSPPDGLWVRTTQRFILYRYKYSRLEPRASEIAIDEFLKPRTGDPEEETPGSREALLQFISRVRDQAVEDPDRQSQKALEEMRAMLDQWGAVKSASFIGLAGSGRWMAHRLRPGLGSAGDTVEVSWNMFEVRHENAASSWLVAVGRDGQVWDARTSRAPWQ